MTTLRELIDQLSEQADDVGDDVEVRVAYQPTYPLTGIVSGVAVVEEEDDREERPDSDEPVDKPVVWITVDTPDQGSGVSPYAPAAAFANSGLGAGW